MILVTSSTHRPPGAGPMSAGSADSGAPGAGVRQTFRVLKVRAEKSVHRAKLAAMVALEEHAPRTHGSLSSVATRRPFYALTYDDGPTPERTPAILQALHDTGSHATFFVLMHNARLNTPLLRDMVAQGHEIALHGMDHRRLSIVPPDELTRLLVEARERLEDVTGQAVRFYRPPYGVQTPVSWRATQESGLTTAIWSRTAWDWKMTDQGSRVEVATMDAKPGLIVLLHDGHAGLPDRVESPPEPVLDRYDLTRRIAEEYAVLGLTSCTLSQLTSYGRPVMRPHFQPLSSLKTPVAAFATSRRPRT